jgi:hypothetical protein
MDKEGVKEVVNAEIGQNLQELDHELLERMCIVISESN